MSLIISLSTNSNTNISHVDHFYQIKQEISCVLQGSLIDVDGIK